MSPKKNCGYIRALPTVNVEELVIWNQNTHKKINYWEQSAWPCRLALLISFSLIREVHSTTEKHYSVREVIGAGSCDSSLTDGITNTQFTRQVQGWMFNSWAEWVEWGQRELCVLQLLHYLRTLTVFQLFLDDANVYESHKSWLGIW